MTTETKPRANWRTPAAVRVDVDENTDRAAWLRERRNGIGGTDAAALMGVHVSLEIKSADDVTPATVFLDKTSADEPVEDDKNIFAFGHYLEPALMRRAEERFGITIKPGGLYRHKEESWRYANPDGLASDGGIVEAKTASNRGRTAEKWLAGDVSPHAFIQTQHYLAVTGRTHSFYTVGIRDDYTGWESVPRALWGEPWFAEMAVKEFVQVGPVERDEAVISAILDAEREFWGYVQAGVMPDHIAAELPPALRWRTTAAGREAVPPIPDMYADDLTRLDAIKSQQKVLSVERTTIEDRLRSVIGEAEYLVLDGVRRARWHTIAQTSFDKAGLLRDHPEIAEAYTRRGTTRRLDIVGVK